MFDPIANPDSLAVQFTKENYIKALESKDVSSIRFSFYDVVNNVFHLLTDLECNEMIIEDKYNDRFYLATSALRIVLEKTGTDYGYYVPTPFEIAQKASEIY